MEIDRSLERIGPKISVVGVGGAGGNAVDNMIRLGLEGVDFLVCNTDAQALRQSLCSEDHRIHLGFNITQGLGAGSSPEIGRSAAEESIEEVMRHLAGTHMLFVTAGMGGGTGTGGAPVIARAARERGILTVGVVTKPFHFEGAHRMKAAEKGLEIIKECVDTLLVIPNQNLFRLATEATTFTQAFAMADNVLYSGVRTFTDLMKRHGLVNLDFADICTVMRNMTGKAMMGTGEATGENRAIEAAEKAIGCLLLDDKMVGARTVLVNITGGSDFTLYEVDEAIGRIKQEVDLVGKEEAHIIFGANFDSELKGALRISVVATGIGREPAPVEEPEAAFAPLEGDTSSSYETSLGSRHGDYTFDEQHFSSFSLKEDTEEFGIHEKKTPKKSFFSRLFSRRNEFDEENLTEEESDEPVYALEKSTLVHQKMVLQNPQGVQSKPRADLEVPAFLRQQRKKSIK